ncbi:hypothetical protein MAPG_04255 [Magnaporthiopsis poae ATCC 64411]|uniref:Uncharacterized protein n=1 Tax=Magnaporthiopsis poae (strain ATCC 64411 / 73-15) TaxID=644358 RepID=A0A0C4DW81_MAGP6|nr:hypothetical protein MAPG_04255 [Magnaporthiopsis poae ATCC 64411]
MGKEHLELGGGVLQFEHCAAKTTCCQECVTVSDLNILGVSPKFHLTLWVFHQGDKAMDGVLFVDHDRIPPLVRHGTLQGKPFCTRCHVWKQRVGKRSRRSSESAEAAAEFRYQRSPIGEST